MRTAKFELKDLLGVGFTIVVMGIGLAYGIGVMSETREDMCDGSVDNNIDGECWQCVNSSYSAAAVDTGAPQCNTTADGGIVNGTAFKGGTQEINSSNDGIESVGKLTTKLPTIVTIIIASIIIGVLVTYLYNRFAS